MKRSAVSLLAFFLLTLALLAGCGGQSASEIIDKSLEQMEQLTSFKMAADIQSTEAGETQNEKFEAKYIRSEKNPNEFNYEVDIGGDVGTIYVVDGYQYANVAGKWYKTADTGATVGVSDFQNLGDMAEKAKVDSETENAWVISYQAGPEFLEQMVRDTAESLGESAKSEMEKQGPAESSELGGTLRINKSTYYLESMTLKARANIQGQSPFSLDGNIKYSDFNGDFTVKLPPEAESAEEIPTEAMVPQ